jgi:hypothetical protein
MKIFLALALLTLTVATPVHADEIRNLNGGLSQEKLHRF